MTSAGRTEQLDRERTAFLSTCRRFSATERRPDDAREALDLLIDWSLSRTGRVAFRSSSANAQRTVKFEKLSDGKLLWSAYPTGAKAPAKVSFLTRISKYRTVVEVEEMRERMVDALGLKSDFKITSKVFEVEVAHLATPDGRSGIIAYLDWVLLRGY